MVLPGAWTLVLLALNLAHAGGSVDVNDVSYLWPPALTETDAARLIPFSSIIDQSLFQEIIALAEGESRSESELPTSVAVPADVARIQSWRLAAMRIDPCAPSAAPGQMEPSRCLQEIRLVVQPFAVHDGVFDYYDFALHVLFELGTGNPRDSVPFQRLWRDLYDLKKRNAEMGIETVGLPLRTHPGFRDETFRARFQETLSAHLRLARLKKITFVGAVADDGPWLFFQGLITGGRFQPEPDPTLRKRAFASIMPAMPGEGGTFTPVPSNLNWPFVADQGLGPSLQSLFYSGTIDLNRPAMLPNQEESRVLKLRDLVHVFNNPGLTNRTNADCMSCHTAMSRRLLMDLAEENPFRFQAPNEHVTLKSAFPSDSSVNFRAFGWFGSRPVVSDRVINESAVTADLVEKLYQAPAGL